MLATAGPGFAPGCLHPWSMAAARDPRGCTICADACYLGFMARTTNRVNVVLDAEHAAKLRHLAERTRTNAGTIARSLLAAALDDTDPDPRDVTDVLDRIDGAFERAEEGRLQVRRGLGIPLEDN